MTSHIMFRPVGDTRKQANNRTNEAKDRDNQKSQRYFGWSVQQLI